MRQIKRRDFLETVGQAAVTIPAASAILTSNARAASGKQKIKIGQIGLGHAHAKGVFAALDRVNEHFEIVGIVENDPLRRKTLGSTYQGVKVITEEQLLNTKGLQAVVVETEVRDLVPTALRCINAGMHIHLDKPPGESLAAYRKLLDDASRRKLAVQMGYIYRYNPAFQFCRQAVKDGWLGEIFEGHGVISKTVGASSRKKLAQYDGGSMFEIGCHVIDAIISVLGKPDQITPYVRRTRPNQDTLADNQLAVFEYPKATVTMRSALIEVEGGQRRQFVVCGDKGTFDIRPLNQSNFRLALDRPRGPYQRGYQEVKMSRGPGFVGDFLDLAAIIRGEQETDFPPSHDLAVHESVLRASGYAVD